MHLANIKTLETTERQKNKIVRKGKGREWALKDKKDLIVE